MKKLLVGLMVVVGVGAGGFEMAHEWGPGGCRYEGDDHHMLGLRTGDT